MKASKILEDQVIHVKRGRLNGLGFEPAFNSYFDFYLESKWFGQPLLELHDVTFHLYLRKNLNASNPRWRMPTYRQMEAKFSIGYGKIEAMMRRLDGAHLLKKESGLRRDNGKNTRNNYILSDPLATLDEFLTVAGEGVYKFSLLPEWNQCLQNRDTNVSEIETLSVSEIETNQQTLKTEQTADTLESKLWNSVLAGLKTQLPAMTFQSFLGDTQLLQLCEGTATITTPRAHACEWIEVQMGNQIKKSLALELRVQKQPGTVERVVCLVAEA